MQKKLTKVNITTDSENESDSEETQSGGSKLVPEDSDTDCSTTELLAADPLYFVLSRFFVTEDGKSIVTVMNDINTKLGKIAKLLEK